MAYNAPGSCPVCGHQMHLTRLTCTHCQTKIEGEFRPCKFCQLPKEQLEFIDVFLKCRGNIKDVERELGISYPTVRNRLEGVIQALGLQNKLPDPQAEAELRQEILSRLEQGVITPKEAAKQLKSLEN